MSWITDAAAFYGADWITDAAADYNPNWITNAAAAFLGVVGDYFVATTGSDVAAGTLAAPFATLGKAHSVAVAGDRIIMRGGTYTVGASIQLTRDGTAGNPIEVWNYTGEVPVLDGATMTDEGYYDGWVIELNSVRYFHLKGLEIKAGPMGGIALTGTTGDGTLELLNVHHNGRGTGEGKGMYVECSGNNLIIKNCDSHHNYDENAGDNADGIFIDSGLIGTGCIVEGNRAWRNSDDGIDFFNARATNNNAGRAITARNNWSWENGYVPVADGSPVGSPMGDGNGFKLGGAKGGTTGNTSGGHTVTNNLAWKNRGDGFAANQAAIPMTMYNNTAWDCVGSGFENAGDVLSTLTNNVAIDNDSGPTFIHANVIDTFNSWNGGVTATAADFESTTLTGAYGARQADGSLPVLTFLHLATGSDLINAGTDVGLPFQGAAPDMGAFEKA